MKFKVGDKVRLKDGGYLPRGGTAYYSNREFAQIHGLKEGVVYEIVDYNELNNVIVLKENYLCFSANRFELVAEHKIERILTIEEKQQSKDEFIKYIIEQATNSPMYERYMLKGGRQWCHEVTLTLPPSFLEELKTLVEGSK